MRRDGVPVASRPEARCGYAEMASWIVRTRQGSAEGLSPRLGDSVDGGRPVIATPCPVLPANPGR